MKRMLIDTNPELIKEWNWNLNKLEDLDPTNLTHGSGKKANWICKKGHTWKARIYSRTGLKTHCPYCSNQKVCKDNCLETTHPKLTKEWSNKNKLKPTEVIAGSNKKAWWECMRCKQEWEATLNDRANRGDTCPYCSNRKVCKSNCLKTTHPESTKEWSNKNKLKPTEVVAGSHKKVWWKCKECKQEWKTSIIIRVKYKSNCPFCSNKKVYKKNCLNNTHSYLIKEWDWELNKKEGLDPTKLTYGSHKKAWWICNKNHKYKCRINHKVNNSGCPICKESKGEKEIAKILYKLNIRYKRQYRFKHFNKYPFDFALFKKYARKPYAVIEYQGEQHYKPVKFGGIDLFHAKYILQTTKQNDKIKKEYCKNNNMKFIEIKYTHFNKIETIINSFLEK